MLPLRALGWTHAGPYWVASRVPFHFGMGSGGFQRRAPVGGSAYGIPLNTWRAPAAWPETLPAGALMTGGSSAAAGKERKAVANKPGMRSRVDFMERLRFRTRVSTHARAREN